MAEGWHNDPLAPFDLETTGVDVNTARIVTACVADIESGHGVTRQTAIRSFLLNPGIEIPAATTAIHGITTEQARRDGQDAAEGVDAICAALSYHLIAGYTVVGHNVSYDLTILDRECTRHGVPTLTDRLGGPIRQGIADSYVLDKETSRRKGSRRLENTAEFYGVPLPKAHDAVQDALAAARIIWRICQTHPRIALAEPTELFRRQVEWRDRQQRSLASYFAGVGKTDAAADVMANLGWPVVPAPTPQEEALF